MTIKPLWPHIDPGDCRDRIIWQRKAVSGQNTFGEDIYDWVNVVTVYAKIVSPSGREVQAAQQRWSEAEYVISHNWVAGLGTEFRIYWRDSSGTERYLDVLDVSDRESKRMVVDVVAKEVLGASIPAPAASV